VLFAHRSPGPLRSIEELFATVSDALPGEWKANLLTAPCQRATPVALLRNLLWAGSLPRAHIVHQTGDIHYAVLSVWWCPVVLTIHDLRFIEESRGIKRLLFLLVWLYLPCLWSNRITVISDFTKSRLLAICRVNPRKVRVISNCVAAEFTALMKPWSDDKPRVLLVGTTDNKNLTRVIKACVGLHVQLCILGSLTEAQKAQLDEQAVEHETYQNLSRQQVVALYQSCDLVCFASTYEGFGMPILEAQSVGRAVLTSDISPMTEVAGEGALKVDPFDVDAIRVGLMRLLTDRELRTHLIDEGFRNVAKYSAESIAVQYAELYREVLDGTMSSKA
jgi:glycosyltransferase involved in cell wall biosynthesis